jgi:UDP-N-acetyl-D-mannosaminouronate:lipid I N-acetyl-D-mannosaminouronosyltransferase
MLTLAPPVRAAAAPTADTPAPATPAMRFRGIGITETQSFPPPACTQCWVYVTVNAEVALATPHDDDLRALLDSQRVRSSVDGQWIWWALRRKYAQQPLAKLSGSDLIYDLVRHCVGQRQRLLLLGSTPAANERAVYQLRRRWPGVDLGGHAPQRFVPGTASEDEALADALRVASEQRPDYIVLGLGPDKQFRFATRLAQALDGKVKGVLCFGGAIDMAGGHVKRAPRAWQRLGLEGIYRLLQQPSRLPRFVRLLPIVPIVAFGRY